MAKGLTTTYMIISMTSTFDKVPAVSTYPMHAVFCVWNEAINILNTVCHTIPIDSSYVAAQNNNIIFPARNEGNRVGEKWEGLITLYCPWFYLSIRDTARSTFRKDPLQSRKIYLHTGKPSGGRGCLPTVLGGPTGYNNRQNFDTAIFSR